MDEQEEFEFRLRAEQERNSAVPPEFVQRLAAERGQVQGETPSIGGAALDLLKQPLYAMRGMNIATRQALGDIFDSERMQKSAQDEAKEMAYQQKAYSPQFESETAQGLYSGAQSLARQVPAIGLGIVTGGAAAPLALLGADTSGEAYTKYRGRGATPGTATIAALGEGGTEIATELLPMGFLVKKFGKVGLGQFLSGMLAREIPSEQVATLVQDAIDTAVANPDKTWGEYLKERPGAAYQTLLATVSQAGLMAGASKVKQKISGHKEPTVPENIKDNLDNIDLKTADHEEAIKTQSQTTMYVGKQGDVTDTLPTQINEDPRITDLARTRQQNEMEVVPWEPKQPDMFPMDVGLQQTLDLRTEPDRSGLARPEDLTQPPRTPEHATYNEGDKGVTSVKSTAASDAQANAIWYRNEAKKFRNAGDEARAREMEVKARQADEMARLASKEYKERSVPEGEGNKYTYTPEERAEIAAQDKLEREIATKTGTIREITLKDGTKVLIEFTAGRHPGDHTIRAFDINGKEIAIVAPIFDVRPGRSYADSEVDPAFRRKGLATAMYDLAEEIGGRELVQSGVASPDARAFWENRRKRTGDISGAVDTRYSYLTDEDYRAAVAKRIAAEPKEYTKAKQMEMMDNPRAHITAQEVETILGLTGPDGGKQQDPRRLKSYNGRTGEFDGVEMFQRMIDDEKNRGYKLIMRYVQGHLKRLKEAGQPIRFALDIDETGTVRKRVKGRASGEIKNWVAYADANTDTLWFGSEGLQPTTIIHEAIHALTVKFLTTRPNDPRSKAIKFIFDSVKNDPIFHKSALRPGEKEYGLTDIKEFLSEAFSNPEFQAKLLMHTVKGLAGTARNAMSRLADEVRKILGIPEKEATNTLEELMKRVDEIVEARVAEAPKLKEEWYKRFPGAENVEGIVDLVVVRAAEDHKKRIEEYKRLQKELLQTLNSPSEQGSREITKDSQQGSVKDAEDRKARVLKDTAGIEHVAKDPVVDEALIEQISKEKDGGNLWALTPGALARAIRDGSTLVLTGYRLLDNAAKRTAFNVKKIVAPVEKTIANLLRNDNNAEIMHDLFMRELRNKRDYTTEELRGAGISDDIIMAHLEFRAMMDQVLDAQNLALADKGLPPVDRLQSFITSRWSGPWRANLRDSDGNIVWQVAEHSRGKAKEALDYILARQPTLKADDLTYRQGQERADSIETAYQDMLALLDPDDERVKTLKSIHEEYVLGKTENIAQQEKHFLRKRGVRGFAGDRPWSTEDAKDMFIQQFEYAKNAIKWAEYQKAVDKLKPLLHDPSLQESQKNNIAYLKEYSKNHLGFGTAELFNKLDNAVAKFLGTSPQNLQSTMGAAKTYFYLSRLGLSVPFTIAQFVQPAITSPGWHSQLSSEGYWHNPIKTTVLGTLVGVEAAVWHYMKVLGAPQKMVESLMDSVDKDAARWMEANGIVEINQLADIKKDMRPQAIKTLAMPFEFTIQHSEIIARSMAFMAYVQHLKQSGMFDLDSAKGRAELFQKAEDMTKISMTDYRSTERALVFERGGLTGDAAATLHSYQINNLFQLYNFGVQFKNGNPAPLMNMMFMQFLSAGLMGMWFIDDLDDAWENFKKLLSHDDYMKYKDVSIKNFILKHGNDFMAYGAVSKLTGTNIHTRMNAADQLPIWPFEPMDVTSVQGIGKGLANMAGNAVPFAGTAGNLVTAGVKGINAATPERRKWEAGYAAAPAVAQGPMERLPAFNEGAVSKNPNRIEEGFRRRTEEEKSLRDFGFRSTAEQRDKDKQYMNSKIEQELARRLKNASKTATDHILDGNIKRGTTEIIKYVDLGGEPSQILNALPKEKLKGMTTELERRAMEAGSGSRASVLKLKRYLDNVGIQ